MTTKKNWQGYRFLMQYTGYRGRELQQVETGGERVDEDKKVYCVILVTVLTITVNNASSYTYRYNGSPKKGRLK